jgi:hypothetical protein
MVLPCHELSSLSSPTWRPEWRIRARLFFGSEGAVDATRFSASAAPVIAGNVTAALTVVFAPFVNNGGAPIVVTNTAPRAVSIIAIVSAPIGNAVRRGAGPQSTLG